jgi:hypothetical protein
VSFYHDVSCVSVDCSYTDRASVNICFARHQLQDAVRVTGIDDKIVHRTSMFGTDKPTLLKFLHEHYDATCARVGTLQLEVIV